MKARGTMHSLLKRQLDRHVSGPQSLPQGWKDFLALVDEAYEQADTDRKMLERSLELSSQELLQMNSELGAYSRELGRSNAELEAFASIASHDLQEPLRTICAYLKLLQRRSAENLDAEANQFIRYAVDASKQMRALISDLLAYAHISSRVKAFEPMSTAEVVDGVIANLKVAISESGARITRDDLPIVLCDRRQMIQLFQNLICNAIKFRAQEPPRVHVSAGRENNQWIFSVKDNGVGFSAKYADKIFSIFQRLHRRERYNGTGIGLAICKKIVERHGGQIWADSKPQKGSIFYFTLPA